MFKCFSSYSLKKAIDVIMKHKDDPCIKQVILELLKYLSSTTDNNIDDEIVNIIKERLYPQKIDLI